MSKERQRTIASIFGLDQSAHDLQEDLRQSVGENALVKLARDAAQIVATQREWLGAPAKAEPSPQALLALLTYCYAAGIYGSQDVEWACRNDPMVHSICANTLPDWPTLWRFRNANRPWIEECLWHVYGAASDATPKLAPQFRGEVPPDIIRFVRRKLRHAVWADAAIYD